MNAPNVYAQASIKTADNLRSVAHSAAVRELSQLSLPEIDTAVDAVAQFAPAGNVPGVILNGLARLPGRRPPAANVHRDINLLFKGVEAALDKGGFDTMMGKHQIALHPVDRITAWLMVAIHLLHQYPDLLANEWRERVYLATLQEVTAVQPDAAHYAGLYAAWEQQRPYGRDRDADPNHNFAAYRRHKFDQFLAANGST